ncbi:MAG: type VI secretion system baseplate subunit TssG [Planctomycetaceae bacterium]|nr:type VI secretion system baseplate subunit TssG [Planctomycetaceae bacterium]
METEFRNTAKNLSLAEQFRREPWAFDFWQAVRILHAESSPQAEIATASIAAASPDREQFRFASHISQNFPASDIQAITDDEKPCLSINFLGLAGAHGPMPPPMTELILERSRIGDTALKDFLDLFNHRLISLFYRAMEPMRPGAGLATDPAETEFAEYLFAVAGLLTEKLKQPQRARLLPYAVLFANVRKTALGLEKIVSERFGVQAVVEEFHGQWLVVEKHDRTQLGRANHRLGETAMLGGRFWNQTAGIVLRLENLTLSQYREFLPSSEGVRRQELLDLVRFYIGNGPRCEVRLQRPGSTNRQGEIRLGWT